jgi:hypothetical protein
LIQYCFNRTLDFIRSLKKGLFRLLSIQQSTRNNANVNKVNGKTLVRWVDIPKTDIALFKSNKDSGIKSLTSLVNEYHSLAKDNVSALASRIDMLNKIIIKTEEILWQQQLNKSALKFLTIAKNKVSYLLELKEIYDKDLDRYDKLKLYHVDSKDSISSPFYPLYMAHTRRYDLSLPGYWGFFWHESIDPCHRKLPEYYDVWAEKKEHNAPFFMWLETQQVPYHVPKTVYLEGQALEDLKVTIKNGKLFNTNQEAIHHSGKETELLFIVTLDYKLLAITGSDLIHHNSISHGKPVLASGTLVLEHGQVESIMMYSGHYVPTPKDASQTISIFNKLSIDISQADLIYFDINGVEKTTSTTQFIVDFNSGLIKSTPRPELPNKDIFSKTSSLR